MERQKIKDKRQKFDEDGFGLVEIVVATGIIAVTFFALAGVSQIAFRVVRESTEDARANFLLEESVEAIRSLRDASWDSNIAPLTSGTIYYPVYNSAQQGWTLQITNPGLIEGLFTRTAIFEDVYRRNSDDDIVDVAAPDPKTLDSGTHRVTAHVGWGTVTNTSVSVAYENGTTDGDLANFPSNNSGNGDPAQSFTTLAGSQITVPRVDIILKRATADPSDIFLELRSGSTVGTVLATSQTIDSAALPASLAWTTFTFPSPPTLAAGTQYYLRLRSVPESTVAFSGSQGTIHWGYLQTGPSPYGGGQAYRYVGRLSNPNDTGQPLSQHDFSFRVYQEISSVSGTQVELITYIADIFQN